MPSDLARGVVEQVAEDDHRAVLGGEAGQGRLDLAAPLQRRCRRRRGPAASISVSLAATSWRTARARLQSIARLTAIRCSQGAKGRRRSKRSSALSAERNASWAMSSAAAASRTIR